MWPARQEGSASRREFLRTVGASIAAMPLCGTACAGADSADAEPREARFYEKLEDRAVRCRLCPWGCVVRPGGRGRCGVRENRKGTYYTLVYGRPCAIHNDPIEKKPFFHVYPGSRAFSIATVGCNIECRFCQNWEISQASPDDVRPPFKSPEQIARAAAQERCRTVAFTYSEPTVFWEYMADCARAARDLGLGSVVVSNGFTSEEPLKELCGLVTAVKVDLKSFSEKFYADVCAGQLEPVKATLKRLAGSGVWFEIVVLLVPGMNDSADEIRAMSAWIVKELGPDVPVHFTRFHPEYKLRNLPATPPDILHRARAVAMAEGCRFAYTGNMPGGEGENTFCPQCREVLVRRIGFWSVSPGLTEGKCHKCGAAIPGLWGDRQTSPASRPR